MILGRVDDVLNVSAHRIGTMEVESALVDHPAVAEAAVVGRSHELKGQAIVAFVSLKNGHASSISMVEDLKEHVVKKIGALARPEEILFTKDLPKTRSGKIMRRLLRDIAEGRALGDVTTLADPAVVAALREDRCAGKLSGLERADPYPSRYPPGPAKVREKRPDDSRAHEPARTPTRLEPDLLLDPGRLRARDPGIDDESLFPWQRGKGNGADLVRHAHQGVLQQSGVRR